ncbi:MAG: WecB/TagA/CpsF family glycosyltransferase [Actinomycetota bacterium]
MTDSSPSDDPAEPLSAAPTTVPDEALDPAGSAPNVTAGDDQPVVADDLVIIDDLERIELFGLQMVNAESLDPVIDELLDGPRRDDTILPVVLTPNVDIVVHLEEDQDTIEADLFRRAQFCLPDGQPLVLFSRIHGERLKARLPGSGLFAELWPRLVAEKRPVIVVASSDHIADRLREEHPKAGFIVPPMFDAADPEQVDAIVDELLTTARAIRPDMVLVGIGNPKDARLIAALFARWDERLGPKPLCLGLGGSFAMYLGITRRAPDWIQRIGMEWFFRFLQEPRRLFHRYFVRDAAFLGIMKREWQAGRSNR